MLRLGVVSKGLLLFSLCVVGKGCCGTVSASSAKGCCC
jgi:hypothetical protein